MLHLKQNANTIKQLPLIQWYAFIFLIGALFHQVALCFLNTHAFDMPVSILMLFEASLLGFAALLFIQNVNFKLLILMVFIISNALILVIFQQYFDPKHVRNFFIPILAIWLGAHYAINKKEEQIDRLVIWVAFIVIGFGLFEAFFSSVYQELLNVRKFHVALGRSNEIALTIVEGTLSLNGMRIGGRNMLEFLFGDHRISSIFLESASMANVGGIIASWGLSKQFGKKLITIYSLGLFIAVMADSRFSVSITLLALILRFIPLKGFLRYISVFMPIVVIAVCFFIYENFYIGFTDDFKGRLGLTGELLSRFKPSEFFGAYPYHYSGFVDSGYPHILHFNGLILALVMWFSIFSIRMKSEVGERFKYLIMIFIATNLTIGGDAIYALKMSGLMWFLMGVLTKNIVRFQDQK